MVIPHQLKHVIHILAETTHSKNKCVEHSTSLSHSFLTMVNYIFLVHGFEGMILYPNEASI